MGPIHTIGHGTLAADALADLLRGVGVDLVVDVRRYPGSRRHPHFARQQMEAWLPAAGIGYRWLAALGGRRTPTAESVNTAWQNPQFRAYADYMATPEFGAGVAELKELAAAYDRVVVMCSESVWWRCHRRLLADHLVVVEGIPVEHVFHDGRLAGHEPLDGARRAGRHLSYPASGSDDQTLF